MKHRIALAALALCLPPLLAQSQTMKAAPSDPGMAKPPADAGAVVQPPPVNDKSIATPPKYVDPKIHSATGDVDRANKEKADKKAKGGKIKRGTAREDKAPAVKP